MNAALFRILAAALIRFVLWAHQNRGPNDGSGRLVGSWGAFVWFVLAPFGALLASLVLAGQVYFLPLVLAIVALTFPWPITRLVLVPLGLPRLAYLLTFTSDFTFRSDRRGGAAVAAAWALGRQKKLDEETVAWLNKELGEARPLRGAGILGTGLVLAAEGDVEGARTLIESVRDLAPEVCPPAARRLANSWVAAFAATRGDWLRAAELGQTLREGGRVAWLLSGIAQSLRLEPMAPGRLGLWIRWAIAPRRRETLPIVRRALAALDGAFVEPDPLAKPVMAGAAAAGDDLSLALSLHASMLKTPRGEVRSEDVRALGRAWDAVLGDRTTERLLSERALLLGASGVKPALERLRGAIEGDLAAVVLGADLKLGELGEQGDTAVRVRLRVRDRLLSDVEAMSDALRRRADDKRALPAIDEWREWNALRRAYERGVRLAGLEFRRLAFQKIHPDACCLAVWLFNEREQRPLGNAIFRFLLVEAEALEDQRAIALQTKNVGCGV